MPYKTLITTTEASGQLSNPATIIIDCRFDLMAPDKGEQQYLHDHLPNAIYAHLDKHLSSPITDTSGRHPLPSIESLTTTFSSWGITPETQVIVYDDNSGMFASRLWWCLRWLGHDSVAVLDGGYTAWKEAGLPLEHTVPTPQPSHFQPRPQLDWIVEADELMDKQAEGFVLLDARAAERYRGEVEPIDPVAGHIPGAANYPLTDNISNGLFRPAHELKTQLTTAMQGVNSDRVIHYCGSGVSACHNILAMEHAGLHGSKLYPGSWSEWIRDPERQIETA